MSLVPTQGGVPKLRGNGGLDVPGLNPIFVHLDQSSFEHLTQILMKIKARFVVQESGEEDRRFHYIKIDSDYPISEKQYGNEHPRFKEAVMSASKTDGVYFLLNPYVHEAETVEKPEKPSVQTAPMRSPMRSQTQTSTVRVSVEGEDGEESEEKGSG